MTDKDETPLRGDAAWRAAKQRVSDNNDAAYKRGREKREAQHEQENERRRSAARRENAQLPEQPQP